MAARPPPAYLMKIITCVLIAATVLFSSGCAQKDWIDRTLVTVDVTGTWYGRVASAATASGSPELSFLRPRRETPYRHQRSNLRSTNWFRFGEPCRGRCPKISLSVTVTRTLPR